MSTLPIKIISGYEMNIKYVLRTFPADINGFTTLVFNLLIIVSKTQDTYLLLMYFKTGDLYEITIPSFPLWLICSWTLKKCPADPPTSPAGH